MKLHKIGIKGEEFKVAIADNSTLRSKGLSGVKKLGKNKGMLFIYPNPVKVNMVMDNMYFDLDFIFLNDKWEVTKIGSLGKDSITGISSDKKVSLVLELTKGTIERLNIKEGDSISPEKNLLTQYKGVVKFKHGGTFEMIGEKVYEVKEDDIKVDNSMMQILNDKGEVVSNIGRGSTVFSREHTDEMIQKYKSGNTLDLADSFIKIIGIQRNQKRDYVKK